MAHKPKWLYRTSVFVTLSFSFFAGHVAIAQANADACEEVPIEVRKVSAALNICDEVKFLHQSQQNKALEAEPDVIEKEEKEALKKAKAANEALPAKLDEAMLVESDLATNGSGYRHEWRDHWLKISAIIIGGVGGGAGGALHLNKNTTVQRAGTWVGIVGGVAGAAVNFLANVCPPKLQKNSGSFLRRYIVTAGNRTCVRTRIAGIRLN